MLKRGLTSTICLIYTVYKLNKALKWGINMELGQRLSTLRTIKGISQTFVANRLNKTPQWLNNIEKGRRNIGAVELNHIAEILGVNVSAFFNDKDFNKALNDISVNNQPTGTEGN